jgi:hypothetical protein
VIVLFPIQNIPDEGQIHLKAFLEIIESVVSSPFVKTEADSVEYVVPCLKRYVRLH